MSDIIDINEKLKNKGGIIIVPPPNPSPKRVFKKKISLNQIEPYIDPGLEELLNFPVRVPHLKREIRKAQQENPIEKEIDLLKRYREKPLLFWRDELGVSIDIWRDDKPPKSWEFGDPVPLWSKQREIIQALIDYRKVSVKSGHGVGKTFLMGGLTLYLGIVWHATGMTTAPTFRQVRRALWGEIHYQYNRALNPLGGKLNQTSLDLGDKWFVEGFATDKPTENITGIHEENIFVIVDEAGGVAPETFEALDALVTSESSFVIYIGNPTSSDGPFYDSFKPKSGFKNFTISCYDCPNVKHDRVIYSKLTSKKWVDEKEKKWGITSPLFLVRVKGEFADQSTDTLIPIKYIEIALNKGKEENLKLTKVLSFGLDVARQGSDNSVYGVCYEIKDRPETFFKIIDRTQRIRETVTAGKMKGIYDELVPEFKQKGSLNLYNKYKIMELEEGEGKKEKDDLQIFPPINIDEINAGGGVSDIMIEDEYPVNEINVSEPPDKSDFEAVGLFLNKRAKYYWNLKMLFEAELVIIDDEDLANELSKFRFEQLRSGKIKIVDKDEIKAELNGKSPDDAETMMLCYSEKEGRNTQDLVHFI
jgi:hypothetical protein